MQGICIYLAYINYNFSCVPFISLYIFYKKGQQKMVTKHKYPKCQLYRLLDHFITPLEGLLTFQFLPIIVVSF